MDDPRRGLKTKQEVLDRISKKGFNFVNAELIKSHLSQKDLDDDVSFKNYYHSLRLQFEFTPGQHKLMIKKQLDLSKPPNQNLTNLHDAVSEPNVSAALMLLKRGEDPNKQVNVSDHFHSSSKGSGSLHLASAKGYIRIVEILLSDPRTKIDLLDSEGRSALFYAANYGKKKAVRYLLKRGADVNISGVGSWKPIHAACYHSYFSIIKILVEHHADLNSPLSPMKDYTPLHLLLTGESAEDIQIDRIEYLLKHNADVNSNTASIGTPLHLASFWGRLDVVELLVKHNASPDIKNEKGRTAAEVAYRYSHSKVGDFLSSKHPVQARTPLTRKSSAILVKVEAPTIDL